jgi:cation diffusion facilitator CzcD-associated flavoprotein CzcO
MKLGIRCDSDLYTYGFPWNPWSERRALANGSAILEYIKQTCQQDGIDKHILFDCKVDSLSWSSKTQTWTLEVHDAGIVKTMRSRFVFLATGYFDYEQPLQASIPGIENFKGDVIHPQFWPEDFDYTNKNVVVIGSGATAISLVPAMAGRAKHVTMLQRSPSYIMSIPLEGDWTSRLVWAVAPIDLANKLIRLKWIMWPAIFRTFCTRFPSAARHMMRRLTKPQLKHADMLDPHFNPTYSPFEQRMCMCPDGDFYECLRTDQASVKTGIIKSVTASSIQLQSDEKLHPDVIVTATGLRLRLGGDIKISVDGAQVKVNDQFVWRGLMFEGIPNLFFSFGYLDASWTLGVDTSAQLACKLLTQMECGRTGAVFPKRSEREKKTMKEVSIMPLTSTYVAKAKSNLPKVGNCAPWKPRQPYLWEQFSLKMGNDLAGLEWIADNK